MTTEIQEKQQQSYASANMFRTWTPSDTDKITFESSTWVTRGILVSVAGTVACLNNDGQSVVIPLVAGVIHPIATDKILATGTTATGIVVFF